MIEPCDLILRSGPLAASRRMGHVLHGSRRPLRGLLTMRGLSKCSPDGANGSRECAPDDRLREIRDSRDAGPGLRFAASGLQLIYAHKKRLK